MNRSIAGAPWLSDPVLQKLLAILSVDGEEARIAGGAVRNALTGHPVADIDIATTCLPEETERRAAAAGFKPVPTGKAHGTITVVANGRSFEVTTLRADIETDGRHATVAFGRDWRADAERRDFTINGLYALADGTVVDLVGGLADIDSRMLRFIGDPEARIREDYLRILRFFRFFAWYGAGRPDAEGIKASARLKDGLSRLSAERVSAELLKLLSAPDPARALLWMRQSGVLTVILPESEKWGIDAIPGLIAAGRDLGWPADPLLRLMAMVPPDAARVTAMARRLRLSKAQEERLVQWAMSPPVGAQTVETALAKMLYAQGTQPILDRLHLSLAGARTKAATDAGALHSAAGYRRLLQFAGAWKRPECPVTGQDLLHLGMPPGKALGVLLKALEDEWVASNFTADRAALLKTARDRLA